MDETTWAVEVDAATELWLFTERASARKALTLWQANGPCIEAAKMYAEHLDERDGTYMVWANVDVTYLAALRYLGELGVMMDHASLALTSHDIRPTVRAGLAEKLARLERLADAAEVVFERLASLRTEFETRRVGLKAVAS